MKSNDIIFRILCLGDSGVGQACILRRYIENVFLKSHVCTIGIDFKVKNINLNKGKTIKLTIWNTAGQERFWNITKQYIKGADFLILIYDITDGDSIDRLSIWVENIKNWSGESTIKIPVFLVGNKIDLDFKRKVTRDEGYKFAKDHGFLFSECSALNGENINYIFNKLVLTLLENNPKYEEKFLREFRKEFKDKVGKEIKEVEEKYDYDNSKRDTFIILKKYISF